MAEQRRLSIASGVLVVCGLVFLALTLFLRERIDFTLPLIFLTLGPGFVALALGWAARWRYAAVFFIPAGVFIALGLVFLLNVITGDWQAWAYAWLLPLAGFGLGGALAANRTPLPHPTWLIGMIVGLAGLALFGVFGAIAGAVTGGLFMRIAAPLLLVAGGLGLRLGWFRALMPAGRVGFAAPEAAVLPAAAIELPAAVEQPAVMAAGGPVDLRIANQATGLAEPLTARETEVLRMIDQGLTNQEIAARLTLAPSTVKTHINNLYGKLAVETRVQAINKGRELKIL